MRKHFRWLFPLFLVYFLLAGLAAGYYHHQPPLRSVLVGVTYYKPDGSEGPTQFEFCQEVNPDGSITIPPPPSRHGFDHWGWYIADKDDSTKACGADRLTNPEIAGGK